jgi:5-methylcytosine-specific restriction endonuclease McrA
MHDQGITPAAACDQPQKRCSKCGEAKSVTDFYRASDRPDGRRCICKACDRIREAADYRENRPAILAHAKQYAREHGDAIRARNRARYYANRDRLLAKQNAYSVANRAHEAERGRAWRAAHPDRVRALNVSYREQHRERLRRAGKEYASKNPEVIRTQSRLRKARLRNARVRPFTAVAWQEVLSGFNGYCAYCLKPMPKATMDHMTPIVRGGEHAIENVIPSCMPCNIWKYDRTILEFLVMQQAGSMKRGHRLTS